VSSRLHRDGARTPPRQAESRELRLNREEPLGRCAAVGGRGDGRPTGNRGAGGEQAAEAAAGRAPWSRERSPAVSDDLARNPGSASRGRRTARRDASFGEQVAGCGRRSRGGLRHAHRAPPRHWRGLLARRTPPVEWRPRVPRRLAAGGADLRQRSRAPARSRRDDVQHAARHAWPHAGRPDHTLAYPPGLHARQPARARPSAGRHMSARDEEPTGKRDAACVVHARSPQRLRDPRAGARARRRGPPPRVYCRLPRR
jgi:hypothetical protein